MIVLLVKAWLNKQKKHEKLNASLLKTGFKAEVFNISSDGQSCATSFLDRLEKMYNFLELKKQNDQNSKR